MWEKFICLNKVHVTLPCYHVLIKGNYGNYFTDIFPQFFDGVTKFLLFERYFDGFIRMYDNIFQYIPIEF